MERNRLHPLRRRQRPIPFRPSILRPIRQYRPLHSMHRYRHLPRFQPSPRQSGSPRILLLGVVISKPQPSTPLETGNSYGRHKRQVAVRHSLERLCMAVMGHLLIPVPTTRGHPGQSKFRSSSRHLLRLAIIQRERKSQRGNYATTTELSKL